MSASIDVVTIPHPRLGSWEVGVRHSVPDAPSPVTPSATPPFAAATSGGSGSTAGAGGSAGPSRRVLLIGGTGQTPDTWRATEKTLLAAGFEVAVYAARGITPSVAPELPWTLDDMAADALAVLDHLGWSEPVALVGYSLGGFTAELLARRHPERVAHAVLLGGHNQSSEVSRAARDTRLAIGDDPRAQEAFERFLTFVTTLDTESLTQRDALARTWWEVLELQSSVWAAPHAREGQGQAVTAWVDGTAERPELPASGVRPVFSLISFAGDLYMPAGAPAERAAESLGGAPWVSTRTVPGGHGALFSAPREVNEALLAELSAPPRGEA
ncbi:alpha/beta fold hydrolase [Dietzia sp.]|uniref:alpha/beta fold hydrolase n=1 Tax=Dietzia sp. TaxID=1871616 RepID=UPI002FDB605C